MKLQEISRLTRIPLDLLNRIEAGRFDELPGEAFIKGFVRSYAQCLGLNIEWMLERYFDLRSTPALAALPPGMTSGVERSNRLGLIVAFIVLFVLCALSLSVVWAPRNRVNSFRLSDASDANNNTTCLCTRLKPSSFAASITARAIASSPC